MEGSGEETGECRYSKGLGEKRGRSSRRTRGKTLAEGERERFDRRSRGPTAADLRGDSVPHNHSAGGQIPNFRFSARTDRGDDIEHRRLQGFKFIRPCAIATL